MLRGTGMWVLGRASRRATRLPQRQLSAALPATSSLIPPWGTKKGGKKTEGVSILGLDLTYFGHLVLGQRSVSPPSTNQSVLVLGWLGMEFFTGCQTKEVQEVVRVCGKLSHTKTHKFGHKCLTLCGQAGKGLAALSTAAGNSLLLVERFGDQSQLVAGAAFLPPLTKLPLTGSGWQPV